MMGTTEGAHEGDHGMMQHCMEMMNSMMGGGAMDASTTATMGSNLPLYLMVALGLGYLVGKARSSRARA